MYMCNVNLVEENKIKKKYLTQLSREYLITTLLINSSLIILYYIAPLINML